MIHNPAYVGVSRQNTPKLVQRIDPNLRCPRLHRGGIGWGLVRLSIGIEDTTDLIGDLDQALECI